MSEVIELETISYRPLREFLDKWSDKTDPSKMLGMEKDLKKIVTDEYKSAYIAGFKNLPPALETFTVEEFNEAMR